MLICTVPRYCSKARCVLTLTLSTARTRISTLAIPLVYLFTGGLALVRPVGWRELTALALVLGALSIILVGGRGLDALRRAVGR